MEKICFLATDQVMKNKIEQALWNHTKAPNSMPIEVVILDFKNIQGQARNMIKEGAQVLIASGGTYQELAPVIQEIPVLRLYISTYDIIYALEQARNYNKIYLLLNSSVIFESSMCPIELRGKIEIHTYKDRSDLKRLLGNLDVGTDIAIVGTAILPRITNIPLPVFTIMPSNPTIFHSINMPMIWHRSIREKDNNSPYFLPYYLMSMKGLSFTMQTVSFPTLTNKPDSF